MDTQIITTTIEQWVTSNAYSAVLGIFALLFGWWLSKFLPGRLRTMLANSSAVDDTIGPVLCQLVRYAILIITLIVVLSQFGVATTSMLAVLGAAGLAIALALQGTLSNIAAGVMLIWLRPFSTGEYIEGASIAGTVDEIGLFATKLHKTDGLYLFVPNSELWNKSITNYSRRPERRIELKIGIAYDADLAKARSILLALAARDARVLALPAPSVHVDELGASAVTLAFRCWTPTDVNWDTKVQLLEMIKVVFDQAGIEIPYNKLDVNLTGPIPQSTSSTSSSNKSTTSETKNPLRF
ncbi:MAG: mechanosensitive ion channel [Devosiaceae bacterium]|nr:mechanosensitive ion channel [Devosiaceae bacterium]